MTRKPKRWKTDVTNIGMVEDEKLNYILKEAKERLKSLITTNDRLIDKSYILAGLMASASIGLTGALISKFADIPDPLKAAALSLILFHLYIASQVFFNLKTSIGSADGRQPKDLLIKEVCQYPFPAVMVSEIEEYQARISKEKTRNVRLGAKLDYCLKLAVASPLVALAVFLVVTVVLAQGSHFLRLLHLV